MKDNYITIKAGPCFHRIAFDSIFYVAVKNRYCVILTSQLAYYAKCTLAELLDDRVRQHLVQVHKSFAVNMRQVTGYSSGELFIHAHRIPIGRAFNKEVKELFVNST